MKFLPALATVALLFAASVIDAQVKRPLPPAVKIPFSRSLQAVVITTKDLTAVQGMGRLFERKRIGSKWEQVGEDFPVVVGRNGLGWDDDTTAADAPLIRKREGDGKAPAGLMPLTAAFGRPVKAEAVALPYIRLREFTECVDDVASNHYNKIVNRMQVGSFDWKSSEKMLAVGDEYDLGVFVAYNTYPVKRGNGSCIFLHVWKGPGSATSGCTAMERRSIERIVGWLQPSKDPYLVQLPEDLYGRYSKTWNLPNLK